ncbi:hypothetical protein Vadar_034285 [Vaccinium darrowii]|uniref:Uncharacterized protein n=1 Tax=Vaccinium darrowii TaxID=229202 RepID=A0ACB7XM66_9ERIC|nr:hypothetical protein Vadar_034285 [Vaccinium darrowii]
MIIRLLMTENSHRFFLVGLFLHGDSKIPHAITFIVRKIGESGRCIVASCLVGAPDGINDGLTKELSATKLYVFGDSIVDNGAKKSLVSGYGPYGIECFWYGKWRFTNGLTIPEMTVVELKLKVPVSFDYMEYFSNHDGVNYASGSAGILPKTGSKLPRISGEDFAELLTRKLGNHLKNLYDLGARKMVIFEIGPLGCLPCIIDKSYRRHW